MPDGLVAQREWLFDCYQWLLPRVSGGQVAIVDIDDAAIQAYGQWPWPRWRLAELIDRVRSAGPRAIGLDILMPDPDRMSPENMVGDLPHHDPTLEAALRSWPSNDAILAGSLDRGRVALPQVALDEAGREWDHSMRTPIEGEKLGRRLDRYRGLLANLAKLEESAHGLGVINTAHGPGEVVRRVPLLVRVDEKVVPSLSLELVRLGLGLGARSIALQGDGDRLAGIMLNGLAEPIPVPPDGQLRPYYAKHDERIRIPAHSAVDQDERLKDKHVLISVSALGVVDNRMIPLGGTIPGVMIHAEAIESMLDRAWLTVPRWAWAYPLLTLAVGGLLLIWLVPRLGLTLAGIPLLALLAAIPIASCALFATRRLLLDPVMPVAGLLLVFGALASSRYLIVAAALRRELLASEHIAGELDAARRIQMGILPDPAAIEGLPSHVGIAARILPAREVGGDFFDVFMLDGRHLFVILGDVSGKGVPAALFMAISKSLCRSVALRGEPAPGRILEALEAEIRRENAAQLFVTAVAGVLDTESGALALSSAGHPPPLRVLPGRVAEPCLVPRAPPLCARAGTRYRSVGQRLADGDRLLLVSDGVMDALSERLSLAQAELAAIAADAPSGSAAALVERVLHRVQGRETSAPADDVAVLGLSWRAPAAPVTGS